MKNWCNNKSYNFYRISYSSYQRRTNNICESFHRTLNNLINHNHPKISYLVDKLGYFAVEAFKNYTASLLQNNEPINSSYNIADDILKFIEDFHQKYNMKIGINNLLDNLENEGEKIYEISKNFIDILFTDGETYISSIKNNSDNIDMNGENMENDEKDNFETEENNLEEKLNNLTINEIEENFYNIEIFEDLETLNEYDEINYTKYGKGKRRYVSKIPGNIIENLYLFKKNKDL